MTTSSSSITPEAAEDIRAILSASGPSSLFGDNERRAKVRYHRLAASVHPDRNGGSSDAEEAFKRLNALWDEYLNPSGSRKPTEIARCDKYAVFNDDGKVLVVNRTTASQKKGMPSGIDRLYGIIDGSPVCMLGTVETRTIAQPDGRHSAFLCDAPDAFNDGAIVLGQLADRVPGGKLHPADLAWIAKRVIFLGGAVEKAGLAFADEKDIECIAVVPDTHMLVVMAPFALKDTDGKSRGTVISACKRSIEPAIGNDNASRRIARFLDGCVVDGYTPTSALIDEYDELLESIFGKPKFHVMEVVSRGRNWTRR